METFVPYPSLEDSVKTYNLTASRVVQRAILNILESLHETRQQSVRLPDSHPEMVKWRGHEPFLCQYGYVLLEHIQNDVTVPPISVSATARMRERYESRLAWHLDCATSGEYNMTPPDWWGYTDSHVAEQAALLRFDYIWFHRFFEGVDLRTPPLWMGLPHG